MPRAKKGKKSCSNKAKGLVAKRENAAKGSKKVESMAKKLQDCSPFLNDSFPYEEWERILNLENEDIDDARRDAVVTFIVRHYEFKSSVDDYQNLDPLDKPIEDVLGVSNKKSLFENTCSFCGRDEDYGFPNGYCCERIACSNCSNVNAGDEEDMCILCSLLCAECKGAWKTKNSFTCRKKSCYESYFSEDDERVFVSQGVNFSEDTKELFFGRINKFLDDDLDVKGNVDEVPSDSSS